MAETISIQTLPKFPIYFTEKATQMALAALSESDDKNEDILRVAIKGGGCSGLQYSLNFVSEKYEEDLFYVQNGLKIAIDFFSARYLDGTQVDYVETLESEGFKFDNPKARKTCGCGSSFSA